MSEKHPDLDSIIVDAVGAMVIATDAHGNIIRFNSGGTRITGYTEEEVLNRKLWDVFPLPENRKRAKDRFSKMIAGHDLQVEAEWLTKSGEIKHLSCHCVGVAGPDGKFLYTIGTGIDSTERAQMEQALREREKRFRGIFADAAIGMALVNEKGRYLHVNRAFCELTGYSETELLRKDLLSITHPQDREHNAEMFHSLVSGKVPGYVLEKRYIRRDGEEVLAKVSATLAPGGDGQPVSIIGLFENVSRERAAEAALQNAYAEVQALNETLERRVTARTASLRESEKHYRELAESHLRLAREVEHRVRNNLQGLLGLLSIMRKRATDVKTLADALEARLAAMQHVHELLAQTRWKAVGMRSLINGALTALQHLACESTEMHVEGPDIFVGVRQMLPLTMVIVEWFTNSCKYGAHRVPGGTVDVRWGAVPDTSPPRVRLTWVERGGPPIYGPVVPSLGTDLVQAFVRNELSGSVELRYPPEGADYVMEFTVREDVEQNIESWPLGKS